MSGLIKDEDIEEVRARTDIVEIISEYVSLKKAGRQLKGLCPFHKEKTPSFMVDPSKQLYHCFGCSEGGNVFTFLMKMDNLNFPESVLQLAERYGYKLSFESSPEKIKAKSLKDKVHEINSLARDFYHFFLTERDEGSIARKYLEKRGYTDELIEQYRIGYAPERWDGVLKFLIKKKYSQSEIEKTGLIIKGKKGSYYDRFRNRLIFPIEDIRGRPIGFGGRVLTDNDSPKYINSPETMVFQKGKNLYGLNKNKSNIIKEDKVVVVEGYTDVLSLAQKRINYTVATLGTAFTSDQADLLARFTENIFLVFDADQAGQKAAERGQELLLDNLDLLGRSKLDISVASLPSGNDPADFIKNNSKDDFENLISKSPSLIEFLLENELNKFDLEKSGDRRKAAVSALNIISNLNSELAREEYLRKIADRLNLPLHALQNELRKVKPTTSKNNGKKIISTLKKVDIYSKTEKEALCLLIQYSDVLGGVFKDIEEDLFTDKDYRQFIRAVKELSKNELSQDILKKVESIEQGRYTTLISSLMYAQLYADDKKKYFEDILIKLKEFKLQRQILLEKDKLERLDPKVNQKEYDKVFQNLIELESAKRDLRIN